MKSVISVASEFFRNPSNLDIYSDKVQFLCVGTGSGATSKSDLPFFFTSTNFDQEWPQLDRVHQVKHHDSNGLLLNESVYRFNLKESDPNALQWLIPGIKLSNPGDEMSLLLAVVAIVEYSDKIDSVRIYWDQGSVLDQLGFLSNAHPKSNTFNIPPNFQLPVLGKSQASKIASPSDLNPFIHNLLDGQGPQQATRHHDSMGDYMQHSGRRRTGNPLQESNESPPANRQLKKSPFKQSENIKQYFDGEDTQDWLPKTKALKSPVKSTVFEDTAPPAFSHKQINPNKNVSQISVFDGQYGDVPVIKRGQGNTSHIFDTDPNFQPQRRGIKRGAGSSVSQIHFGNEGEMDRPGKSQFVGKNQSHFDLEHHSEEVDVGNIGGKKRLGQNNQSHFSIADSGRMDPKQEYHGRGKVISN